MTYYTNSLYEEKSHFFCRWEKTKHFGIRNEIQTVGNVVHHFIILKPLCKTAGNAYDTLVLVSYAFNMELHPILINLHRQKKWVQRSEGAKYNLINEVNLKAPLHQYGSKCPSFGSPLAATL